MECIPHRTLPFGNTRWHWSLAMLHNETLEIPSSLHRWWEALNLRVCVGKPCNGRSAGGNPTKSTTRTLVPSSRSKFWISTMEFPFHRSSNKAWKDKEWAKSFSEQFSFMNSTRSNFYVCPMPNVKSVNLVDSIIHRGPRAKMQAWTELECEGTQPLLQKAKNKASTAFLAQQISTIMRYLRHFQICDRTPVLETLHCTSRLALLACFCNTVNTTMID